tara:strand:+ start:6694 stop:7125 length:432 start_codon:yes stop_codon:yes gene_type:complete
MGRPIYETDENKKEEKSIGKIISRIWKSEVWKLPPLANCGDLLLAKSNELVAIVEIKRRYNEMSRYDTYMISKGKLERIFEVAEKLEVVPLVVVQFSDFLAYFNAGHALEIGTVAVGGRYDRDDPQDTEEVVHIPMTELMVME